MGNSLSGGNDKTTGGGGGRPGGGNVYPLTVNSNALEDGHYLCFYSSLTVDQINNICKSLDGVAGITDLTIIISGATTTRSNMSKITSKYIINKVMVKESESSSTVTTDDKTDDKTAKDNNSNTTTKKDDDTTTTTDTNTYGISLLENSYIIISSAILLNSATKNEIILKRSINENEGDAIVKIGSSFSSYTEKYFDCFLTDDLKTLQSSSNPINKITKIRVFQELPAATSIYFNITTLQLTYSGRFSYITVCNVNNLNLAMSHFKSVNNNSNCMAIYYYDKKDNFLRDALKTYVYDKTNPVVETSTNDKYIFSIGHNSPNPNNKTVRFLDSIINLTPDATTNIPDFKITTNNWKLLPTNISKGFQLSKRMFSNGIVDNTTQVFGKNQTIQYNRSDFMFYVGFLKADTEIDIVGTLFNATTLPTRKFILYYSENVFGDYNFPNGLYRVGNNGITNIANLKDGVNISNNYSLTLGLSNNATVEQYDIISTSNYGVNVKTLRNNHVNSKQAIFSSHPTDLTTAGAYVSDSVLIIPSNVTPLDTNKFYVILSIKTTPTAVWNLAKNLLYKYNCKNFVIYVTLIEGFSLNNCNGFTIYKHKNKMILICPDTTNQLTYTIKNEDGAFSISNDKNEKLFYGSQSYIDKSIQKNYLNYFSIYPEKIPSSESEYQQFKYALIQNMSYIDYNVRETQVNLSDLFVGGPSNTLTLYLNMVKLPDPIINQVYLNDTVGIYFDYFPSITSKNLMDSYINVFRTFLNNGDNKNIIGYTCLMRVRKEWLTSTNKPDENYFQIIEGDNKDYSLLFMFGGKKRRFIYNSGNKSFTSSGFQSIILNTEEASKIQPTNIKSKDIYIENPLDAVIKTSDAVRNLSVPLNVSFNYAVRPITSYEKFDFISLYLRPYAELNSSNTVFFSGDIIQSDISLTRCTAIYLYLYETILLLNTINNKTINSTYFALFINILDIYTTNTKLPSFLTHAQEFFKTTQPTLKVIYDSVNNIYIITNAKLIISPGSDYYSLNNGKILINSPHVKYNDKYDSKYDLMLDLSNSKFEFDSTNITYQSRDFGMRTYSGGEVTPFSQVDIVSRTTSGITVNSKFDFWQSVYSFIYLPEIDKVEVENLQSLNIRLRQSLRNFFIVSLVSYDNTTSEPWIYDKCIVIRGNENHSINITKNQNRYYIKIYDIDYTSVFMKFGLWYSGQAASGSDLLELDFLFNKSVGINYMDIINVLFNERVDIQTNYYNFTIDNTTLASFPKFSNFLNISNRYILFQRPVDKGIMGNFENGKNIVLVLEGTDMRTETHFSEIINYLTQIHTMAKGNISYIIFYKNDSLGIKKPDSVQTIRIDKIDYSSDNFVYTENPNVVIFPKTSNYDSISKVYNLTDNIQFTLDNNAIFHGKTLIQGPPFKMVKSNDTKQVAPDFNTSHLFLSLQYKYITGDV